MAFFVLVPSPLCGATTWAPVAGELSRHGHAVLVPALSDDGSSPFWPQHAVSAAVVIPDAPGVVLAGHSGAGPLLPAIAEAAGRPLAAYLFVDAGLPAGGASHLDHLDDRAGPELRRYLEAGGRFPEWSDADLAEVIPDRRERATLLADLRPRGLAFWVEPLPVPDGWPDAPCAYLQLSPRYAGDAARAEEHGWPVGRLAAGHFHTVVDPAGVAAAMLALVEAATGRGGPA